MGLRELDEVLVGVGEKYRILLHEYLVEIG